MGSLPPYRSFTPAEEARIARAQDRTLRQWSLGESAPVLGMLASPGKGAALWGGLAAVVGGVAGATVLKGFSTPKQVMAGALGAALLGVSTGAAVFLIRRAENERHIDSLRRSPEGTLDSWSPRDRDRDPEMRAESQRRADRRTMYEMVGGIGLVALGMLTAALAAREAAADSADEGSR